MMHPRSSPYLPLAALSCFAMVCVLWAFSLLLAPPPAWAQDQEAFLIAQLDMERELLADDLRQYADARELQRTAGERVEEALTALDVAIAEGTVTLGGLERLSATVETAEEGQRVAQRRSAALRARIFDRLRRTALLGDRLEQLAPQDRIRLDPVTGHWELEMRPGGEVARLRLHLNGTLINGTYQMEDGGGFGSFRGTFTGDGLQLERIDSRGGLDSLWVGEVDPVRRELRGSWTATDLSSGGPAAGSWSARRIDPEEEDEDAEEETDEEIDEEDSGGATP